MKCPSCKKESLVPSFIEASFRGHTCAVCGGNWILIQDFISWSEINQDGFGEAKDVEYELEESQGTLICPIAKTIMHKYRINSSTDHKLDFSPRVGGVWLDSGEWQYLREHGLARTINSIFTDQWQKQIRKNDKQTLFSELYERKFGTEDYQKIKELRAWLEASESKFELRSYLLAENPYGT